MKTIGVAARTHLITLEDPGPRVSDGKGGFTQTWSPLSPPTLYGAIKPATARDLERVVSSGVQSTASHIITVPFHAGISTKTRVSWTDAAKRTHTAAVTGVQNKEERCIELDLTCEENVA